MSTLGISALVKELLEKRGVHTHEAINAFLQPDYSLHTHSPSLLSGIEAAVSRVLDAVTGNERIAIYADFDCDGIPGAAVLSDFFAKIGYENVEVYLPHRDREGYGFHTDAIQKLHDRDVKLIITVDVGTVAYDAIHFANNLGVNVIVTDHHEILGGVPDALAVINPKIAPYPFPHLCGAAMAFKLVQALLAEGRTRELESFLKIPEGWEKWLLDLVAIATVADMVPLVGENRALVHWGLQVLRKSPRPGITALCTKLRLRKNEITEDDIGFSIAPRVNAASRMDEPMLAFELLTTRDSARADLLAAKLEELNTKRKGVVGAIVREARKRMKDQFNKEDQVVVIGNPDWKPSLMGLAANSMVGDRGGIVCMWGRDAHGNLKGSCRSDGVLSIVDLFVEAKDSFIEFGGHAASGGFSVSHEKIHTLQADLAAAAARLTRKEKEIAEHNYDALVTLREVAWPLFKDVSQLAPFGMENPKPVFRITGLRIAGTKQFGKEKNHFEVSLVCATSGATARAFDFFRKPEEFSHLPVVDGDAVILATLERDTYRGGLALRLVDVLSA